MSGYWRTLSHNGICFPDPYKPEGLSARLRGKASRLSPLAEEMAYQLAKKKDTPYFRDDVFIANFLVDFLKQLPGAERGTSLSEMDLSQVYMKVDQEKASKEAQTKDERKALATARKERREALKARYGKALLDGKEVDIANWMAEPPGIFMGRGLHPMRGRWKPRVIDSDIILNLGESVSVPPGNWKAVVHDHDSMWMAKWVDKLTDKEKYVWLHESSPLQQSRNKAKYDNALKVGANLGKIRAKIAKELDSKDERTRQVATVCYLIDNLGMRVGDEKDEDEADTVGASTLRVEHVKVTAPQVEFNFLGKDSVPWNKKDTPPSSVIRNLEDFMSGKPRGGEVFHGVSSAMVNQFLSSIAPGVTAKVFRTHHATAKTEEILRSRDLRGASELDKVYHAKEANLRAAAFCNHQRTPPKTWDQSLDKKKQKVAEAKARQGASPERVKKLQTELDFFVRTKNYNLTTSMKNYIDPRVYKSWCDYVGLDWAKVYSKSLLKKFSWAAPSAKKWEAGEAVVSPAAPSTRPAKQAP
jgi:DNA topoisomerase I